MRGRLNTIQRTMLQWSESHPYNAVHVVEVRGALDVNRLRASVSGVLERHHLSCLVLDHRRGRFEFQDRPVRCEIEPIPGKSGLAGLVGEMERQLNLPFDHRRAFCPFRFFFAPTEGSFFLGLVYFHPLADAESIMRLLQEMLAAYSEGAAARPVSPVELYPDNRVHLLSRHLPILARKVLALLGQFRNLRQSVRPRYRNPDDATNGFALLPLPPDTLPLLLAKAKAWQVTVNDLLLALLMKALSPCAAARPKVLRRTRMSLGCIVNLRHDLGADSRRAFGLFLGSFLVTHSVPEGFSVRDLARNLAVQTAAIKRRKLYLATPLELGFARFTRRFYSPDRQRRLYVKHYPLWGGITNLNLDRLWDQPCSALPMDYLRGVSTGPVIPLALSVTTIGERMNFGLSYRTTVFARADIEALQVRFRERIEETRTTM